jgi:DNA primase
MAYSIPDDIVEKVRETADIVEVISDHIALKPAGRNFKALCPFHPEKTPSFVVSPEKQIYHCFGCGAGGNVFNFLMQTENITFPEAVRNLAGRYGIKVPKPGPGRGSEADLAYRINAYAAKVFRSALLGTKEGTSARKYLRSRGVSEEIEKEFSIGYAPSQGDFLLLQAKRHNLGADKLRSLGLAIEKDGRFSDLFKRRLMFPITSPGGRVIGFGGRVLDDSQPKYLNSPETRLFKKSQSLYGIHTAKGVIRSGGTAIVTEGYMDVIPLHAHGFGHAIASLGTAFTFDQARNIKRYGQEVIFLYDGDEAGRVAALRACAPAVQAGLKAKVVLLPEGEDPDSFLRLKGRDALETLLTGALHYVDFIMAQTPPEDLEEGIRFALGVIGRIGDPVRQSLDLRKLSERCGIPEVTLERSLQSLPRERGSKPEVKADDTKACDKLEKSIISILIGLPDCVDAVFREISPSDFVDHRMRNIAQVILDKKSKNLAHDASALLSAIHDETTRKLLIDCSVAGDIHGDPERVVTDHILSMKRRAISREIAQVRRQIQAAEKDGDAGRLQALLTKRQSLAEDLKLLST